MLRLADDIQIILSGADGYVERPGKAQVVLAGEGARLRTLTMFLRTPRPEVWLHRELANAHPQSSPEEFVRRLITEEILVPWDLPPKLSELHRRTTLVSEWPLLSPVLETARILRESAGEGAIALPLPTFPNVCIADALHARRTARQFTGASMTASQLATILAMGAGLGAMEKQKAPLPLVPGGPPSRRTYPSGGGLYIVETIVYPQFVEGLEPQFYYYQVLPHRLIPFAPMQPRSLLLKLLNDHPVEDASVLFFLFVDFARVSLGKYGEKSYRLALLEAGHIAQNVLLLAAGLHLAGLPICGFYDNELSVVAGLAFPYEVVIYILALGTPLN